jgi:acylphosphatase
LTSAIDDPTQKKIVENVTGEIDTLVKNHDDVTVEAVVDKFTELFKQFGEDLNEGQQRAARHAVYKASAQCNGPDGDVFRAWAQEKTTHTALVEKAHVTEEEYQDLLNNLD